MKNVKERDTSLEMLKEEFVKSYNLRRKDDTVKMSQKKESDKSKRIQIRMIKKEPQMKNQKILLARKKIQKIWNQK